MQRRPLVIVPIVVWLLSPALPATAAGPVPADVVHQCLTAPAEPMDRQSAPKAVCRVDVDGGDERVLAAEEGVSLEQPVWSPDGRRIAFTSSRDGVVVMAGDGSDRQVVAEGSFRTPAWSPDGTRLAFTGHGDHAGLWVLDLPAGELRLLHEGEDSHPSWAPDASALVVTVAVPEHDYTIGYLHLVPLDGGPARDLGRGTGPAPWSPDGRYVAVGDHVLRVVATDGSGSRVLKGRAGSATGNEEGYDVYDDLAWSPDGAHLAFAYYTWVTDVQRGYHGLGTVAWDGSAERTLTRKTDHARDRAPAWRSDGTEVVFVRGTQNPDTRLKDVSTDLYAVRPDGTGLRRLTTGAQASAPDLPRLVNRPAGATRITTAVSVSRMTRVQAGTVVVARADEFPDALSAAPLAAAHEGPLLLSPSDGAPSAVTDEVRRLGATTAYLIGDQTALSARVEADLRAAGVVVVHRLGGQTRYDTAADVAREVGGERVYVASGEVFADAAAVSALAAHERRPVLLTAPDAVPAATSDVLQDLDVNAVTVIGGPAVVSDAVARQLGQGRRLDRIAGRDRYATSAAVAERSIAAGLGTGAPWLATGRGFPDALAAGPGAAATGSVLLLVDPVALARSPASAAWLAARRRDVFDVVAVGGPDVVSPAVAVAAVRDAQ